MSPKRGTSWCSHVGTQSGKAMLVFTWKLEQSAKSTTTLYLVEIKITKYLLNSTQRIKRLQFADIISNWRRGWDSNPRRTFTLVGVQDRCIRPLCHLSYLGLGEEIRTPDPLVPNQMRYQTALHRVKSVLSGQFFASFDIFNCEKIPTIF